MAHVCFEGYILENEWGEVLLRGNLWTRVPIEDAWVFSARDVIKIKEEMKNWRDDIPVWAYPVKDIDDKYPFESKMIIGGRVPFGALKLKV